MTAMNFAEMLQMIQGLRDQLETLGVTPQGLWIALGVAFVLFVFSLREVASWYLRVNQVRSEVRALRAELMTVQKTLEEVRGFLQAGAAADEATEKADKAETESDSRKPDSSGSHRFRFDH